MRSGWREGGLVRSAAYLGFCVDCRLFLRIFVRIKTQGSSTLPSKVTPGGNTTPHGTVKEDAEERQRKDQEIPVSPPQDTVKEDLEERHRKDQEELEACVQLLQHDLPAKLSYDWAEASPLPEDDNSSLQEEGSSNEKADNDKDVKTSMWLKNQALWKKAHSLADTIHSHDSELAALNQRLRLLLA